MSDVVPRVLIAGHWRWDIYEEALADGFRTNGWSVVPFRFEEHLHRSSWLLPQLKLKQGLAVGELNRCLLDQAREQRPHAVLLHAADLIMPATLKRLGDAVPGAIIVLYHNDNPFHGARARIKWRHFLRAIPLADVVLVYRPADVFAARRCGARRVEVLPPYYVTYRHRPLQDGTSGDQFDVVFIGHYEADGRGAILDHLVTNGIRVGLFGTGWEAAATKYAWIDRKRVHALHGDDYSRMLSSSKMALVFLSAANRDVWTRRCFEIPACRTAMLAPRTPELEALFTDRREAIYYDSAADLLAKVRHYLDHPDERERIASAGWRRCIEAGHHQIGRVALIIETIREIATGRIGPGPATATLEAAPSAPGQLP